MPVKTAHFTCSKTNRQKVVEPSTQPQLVQLHNATKASNEYIFLGNDTLTLANGYHMDSGESIQIILSPGDDLYAMSDPNGLVLHVLAVTQD